ncbi:OmpA family protein [Paracoccus zeaxanthinifaciens]|uniref:OmpA family protein n=1 Tax=Paracoccus zeaxanthinifaciens TaxID=187400 RepID=UPI0003B57923|nr:OmpA family protein [Paracoccus zeaxanthinifaciens]
MRRIIHNTTAIAACLSLLAPHMAAAQAQPADAQAQQGQPVPADQGGADQAPADQGAVEGLARQAGEQIDAAEDELKKALRQQEEQATEAEAEAPQADAPQAEAPQQDAPAAEAPAEAEPQPQPAEQAPAAEPEAAPEAKPEPVAEPETAPQPEAEAPAERPEAAPAQAEEGQRPARNARQKDNQQRPAAKADRQQEEAPEARPAEAATEAPEAEADAAPVEEKRPARKARENAEDTPERERPSEDELGAALAAKAEGEPEAENAPAEERREAPAAQNAPAEERREAPAPQNATDEQPAANGFTVAGGGVAQERAGALPGLARVLNDEVSGGLTADQLTCLDGSAGPCEGPATTPRGVVVEPNGGGAFRLAAPEAQTFRVNSEGELVQRAAEEDVKETEASREAAEAAAPSTAAALEAEEGSGNVTEEEVTEADARSSSEDFETSLRDALTAGREGAEAREDDDDDNDLTKALLLGLGAVAVGSYLNNNRQVALSTPDRVVVTRSDGSQEVIKDEVALLRQPGSTVQTENFDDGSSRTVVTRSDGSKVVTIRDADLRVLRRTLVSADGQTTRLIDDTENVQPVNVADLPEPAPVQYDNGTSLDEAALRDALRQEAAVDRRFTLSQVRNIPEVRALVAPVNIDAITFETGSAAIRPDQAKQLSGLGNAIQDSIAENPSEVFLIEGHTDTVGSDAANLALSDRRAESVALALTEYFDVPPENLVTQGYGEQFLRVRSDGDIRENRRAAVRRITDLIAQ